MQITFHDYVACFSSHVTLMTEICVISERKIHHSTWNATKSANCKFI